MDYGRTLILLASAASLALGITGSDSHKAPKPKKAIPTFAKDVAPILYAKCAGCHHEGEVAPFSLMTYNQAKNMAPTIAAVTKRRIMPPWHAVSKGEFANERSLTTEQMQTLEDWAKSGAPSGDLKAAPKAPTFTPGWLIGKPDLIAQPEQAYEVAADGGDEYRCFVIKTDFKEPRYVSEVEVRPGNPKIVHHVIIYLDTTGAARKKDGKDGKPGYSSFGGPGVQAAGTLGGWAPGTQPQVASAKSGYYLPKGADIILQVHYHKDGKPETDLTKVGLKFANGPVDKEVRFDEVGEMVFTVPPGEANYPVTATTTLEKPVTVFSVIPHMHLLGKDMKVTATLPDGTQKQVVRVDHYDFNWQTSYAYREPLRLPAGTVLTMTAHFDNSAANPHNPNNPPKLVRFGEQTTDEMCFAFFTFTYDAEHLTKGVRIKEAISKEERGIIHIFEKFDADHDGYLDAHELGGIIEFFARDAAGPRPEDSAKMAILGFGKAQKGKMNKAEFMKMLGSIPN